jgi:hypothetical protein
MKVKIAALSVLFLLAVSLNAQDQLFRTDNSSLKVKIVEVGPDEIKYKLFSNVSGPTYVESRSNVSLIVYENGKHEVINATTAAPPPQTAANVPDEMQPMPYVMSRKDSLTYYQHGSNISLNFLTFFNNEVGFIYTKEFFASNFNIMIPFGFGVTDPPITNSVYFDKSSLASTFNSGKKLFEIGFGIHYYPSLKTNVNYYIGPMLRYLQYDGVHTYQQIIGPGSLSVSTIKYVTLSRYCFTVTNGLIFRTRSRLTVNFFASLGFKNDVINNPVVDPNTGLKTNPFNNPMSLYFWGGFNVGYNF